MNHFSDKLNIIAFISKLAVFLAIDTSQIIHRGWNDFYNEHGRVHLPAQDEHVVNSDSPETSYSFRSGVLFHLNDIEPDSLKWVHVTSRAELPQSVYWEPTPNPDNSKPHVPIASQMGSNINSPPTLKFDSRSNRACISRPQKFRPQSIVSSAKSKWTGQIKILQLLPSKTRVGSGKVEPVRGTTRLYSC